MDEIELEFQYKALKRGGIYFLTPIVAIEMIQRCRELQMPILGIDGFYITEQGVQPTQDHSIDYSIFDQKGGYWDEATEFIRQRMSNGLMFEIVYEN